MVQFQLDHGVLPAKKAGYSGVAWDNFNLENAIEACGHYDEQGGWVTMYNGTNETIFPDGRVQYQKDVLAWTEARSSGCPPRLPNILLARTKRQQAEAC